MYNVVDDKMNACCLRLLPDLSSDFLGGLLTFTSLSESLSESDRADDSERSMKVNFSKKHVE